MFRNKKSEEQPKVHEKIYDIPPEITRNENIGKSKVTEQFDRISLDDFAIAAMQSIIIVKNDTSNPTQLADRAYQLAAGMLKKSREMDER
jgi:hypothetical protein